MSKNQLLASSILGYTPSGYVSISMNWVNSVGMFYEIYIDGSFIACSKV